MSGLAVAVDVGGTSIKFGLVDQEGAILERLTLPTPVGSGEDAVVDAIAKGIAALIEQSSIEDTRVLGVGIGSPGYLDKEAGMVMLAPNIGWSYYPLKEKLEERMKFPVWIDNDANLAAVGERWKGAGQLAKHMIMVTLGTGVGGGIIVNGEIVSGVNGVGGEIGHITVNPNGALCGCKKFGCLETESSATAIKRKALLAVEQGQETTLQHVYREKGEISPRDVAEAAKLGDAISVQIYNEASYYLALALSGLANSLNPEKILIGGGVERAGEVLYQPLRQYFSRFTLPEAVKAVSIEPARLGNDAGMIGAAYMVLSQVAQLHKI